MASEYAGTFGMERPIEPPEGGYLIAMVHMADDASATAKALPQLVGVSKYSAIYRTADAVKKLAGVVNGLERVAQLADVDSVTRHGVALLYQSCRLAHEALGDAVHGLGQMRGREKLANGEVVDPWVASGALELEREVVDG